MLRGGGGARRKEPKATASMKERDSGQRQRNDIMSAPKQVGLVGNTGLLEKLVSEKWPAV